MEIQWFNKYKWFIGLWSCPSSKDLRISSSSMWNVDTLWRLEIRSFIFLYGLNPTAQQFEHSFEGFGEKEKDFQSTCRSCIIGNWGCTQELCSPKHFFVIFELFLSHSNQLFFLDLNTTTLQMVDTNSWNLTNDLRKFGANLSLQCADTWAMFFTLIQI